MAKVYQLVAWTCNGQVRMIPSEVTSFMHQSLDEIDSLIDKVRYGTRYEVRDLLQVSEAYERFGFRLLELGRIEDAFNQFAEAADCCCRSENNWKYDDEFGAILCRPLRGRFFAMYGRCKDLVWQYPALKYKMSESGLDKTLDIVTEADQTWRLMWADEERESRENREFAKALNFGRDEVYRRRRG
ncbi:MAG: hypothetical protein J5801_00120 [Bacteroidales bacterium]|nr:hypothetical protein [Bacteroidales bacterium]